MAKEKSIEEQVRDARREISEWPSTFKSSIQLEGSVSHNRYISQDENGHHHNEPLATSSNKHR